MRVSASTRCWSASSSARFRVPLSSVGAGCAAAACAASRGVVVVVGVVVGVVSSKVCSSASARLARAVACVRLRACVRASLGR